MCYIISHEAQGLYMAMYMVCTVCVLYLWLYVRMYVIVIVFLVYYMRHVQFEP